MGCCGVLLFYCDVWVRAGSWRTGSGEIEFKELQNGMRKYTPKKGGFAPPSKTGQALSRAIDKAKPVEKQKKLTGLPLLVSQLAGSASGNADRAEADDVAGSGDDDFFAKMKKRAADYCA
jgi:hypothetical protein